MLSIIFRTVVVYIFVVFAMRLMGKRQLGELQPAELVTTFLISNVASICIEEPDLPLLASLVPILLIAALEVLNSSAAWKFPRYAQFLFGKPITVIWNGRLQQNALREMRISASDLAEALRGKDIFSPAEVSWGTVEPNGSVSAATDKDPMLPLVVDGLTCRQNLSLLGLDEAWLRRKLEQQNITQRSVLLLLHNGQDQLLILRDPDGNKEQKNNA